MLIRVPRARLVGAACGVLLAACAGRPVAEAPAPADIPALEAQRAARPGDPAVTLRLAEAYYAANRYADARAALATTLGLAPGNAEARLYLGYTYEGLNQFDSARATYAALAAAHPPRAVERLLAGRLEIVNREALVYAARQALAQESTLTRTPPPPNTVAVMPFRYTGTDTTYQPLERGLAALVVTDLARVKSLRLVERERLQALLDEMQLAASGRVDPATGARSGRLVGAGSVVEGQFSTDSSGGLALQASVVRAADAAVAATGQGADPLDRLFDLEKQVVLEIVRGLGITLTPAEEVAISQRPTRNLEAFLLYSRGLEASDRGDYGAAAQDFQAAAQADPGFSAARAGAQGAQAAQAAAATPPAEVAADLGGGPTPPTGGALLTAINNVAPTGASVLTGFTPEALSLGLPPTNPNGICEAAGCQGPPSATLIGTIIIIVKRP